MGRGANKSPDEIKQIMSLWLVCSNAESVARQLHMPVSTVKGVIDRERDKPEYNDIRLKMRELYSEDMLRIAKKALQRLEKTIDDEDVPISVHHLVIVIGTLIDKYRLIHEADSDVVGGGGIIQITQATDIDPRPEGDEDD